MVTFKWLKGYKVLHQNTVGPGRGGLRMDPNSTVERIQALAIINSWVSSLPEFQWGAVTEQLLPIQTCYLIERKNGWFEDYTASVHNLIGPEK